MNVSVSRKAFMIYAHFGGTKAQKKWIIRTKAVIGGIVKNCHHNKGGQIRQLVCKWQCRLSAKRHGVGNFLCARTWVKRKRQTSWQGCGGAIYTDGMIDGRTIGASTRGVSVTPRPRSDPKTTPEIGGTVAYSC